MANASSLNTLYSLINGPNADRIGGFIYNAQVDDAARQREATRQADANIALGNKQAEYSLTSALSRAPETAAMFRPGQEVLAPGAYDLANSLMQQLPAMQSADLAGKKAETNYKLAAADRARREPVGSDKTITPYQQELIAIERRKLDQGEDDRTDRLAATIRAKAATDATNLMTLAKEYNVTNKPEAARSRAQAQAVLDKAEQQVEQLYTRRSSGRNVVVGGSFGTGPVQPTAAPQAQAPTAPAAAPVDRSWHVEHAKTALARVTDPARRAEIMATAAKNGVTEQDLAK